MPATEAARQEIASLVDKYQNFGEKDIKKYTEADTRRVFILPLFKRLSVGMSIVRRRLVRRRERQGDE